MGTCYSCDNPPCEAPTTSTSTCTARPINCYIKEVAGGYEYGCGCPENAVCCADNSKCNLVSIIPGKSYNSGASYGLTVGLTVTLGVFLVVLFAFLIGFGLWLLIRRFLLNTPLAQKGFFSKRILRNPLQHPLQQRF